MTPQKQAKRNVPPAVPPGARAGRRITGRIALLVLFTAVASMTPAALAQQPCPARASLGYGESIADVARRCGVSVEAIERFNPGLDRDRPQQGVHFTVPRSPLPSPSLGVSRNAFVPVPTPPGVFTPRDIHQRN